MSATLPTACAWSRANCEAVLFDLDGTLMPSLPLWLNAFHYALAQHGITASDKDIVERCFYRNWDDSARDLGIASSATFANHVEHGLLQAFATADLFETTAHLLARCREHKLKIALVSSSPRRIVDLVLTRHQLQAQFDFVICGDEVTKYKPDPEPLQKALLALDCSADRAIMIGDSRADILAGKAAGTATGLFLPDDHAVFYSFEMLRATEPNFVFANHHELLQWLT